MTEAEHLWPACRTTAQYWIARAAGHPMPDDLDAVLAALALPLTPDALLVELVRSSQFEAADLLLEEEESLAATPDDLAATLELASEITSIRLRQDRLGPRSPSLEAELKWLRQREPVTGASRQVVLSAVHKRLDDAESVWTRQLQKQLAEAQLPPEREHAIVDALRRGAPAIAEWLMTHPGPAQDQPEHPLRWVWGDATRAEVHGWLVLDEPAPAGFGRVWRPSTDASALLAWLGDPKQHSEAALSLIQTHLDPDRFKPFPALADALSSTLDLTPDAATIGPARLSWKELVRAFGAPDPALQLARAIGRQLPLDTLVRPGIAVEDPAAWLDGFLDLHGIALGAPWLRDRLLYESGQTAAVLLPLLRAVLADLPTRQVPVGTIAAARHDKEVVAAVRGKITQSTIDLDQRHALAALIECSVHKELCSLGRVFELVGLFDDSARLQTTERALEALCEAGLVRRDDQEWGLPLNGLAARIVRTIGDPVAWLDRDGLFEDR